MDGDVADAELACLFDECDPDIVVEEESDAFRPELRVGFPRGDAMARGELVHSVDVGGVVRAHAAMDVQAMRALELFHDARRRERLVDGERLALACRGDEGEDHEVGVRIHENVLHEFVRADALQVIEAAAFRRGSASRRLRHRGEGLRIGADVLQPRALRIHEVSLDVEDEFVAIDRGARELQVVGGLAGDLVEAAARALPRVGRVHREQRARRTASRDEESAPRKGEPARAARRGIEREAAGQVMDRRERNRRVFTVRRRVELDREAPAFGIVAELHRALLDRTSIIRQEGNAHARA